MQIRSSLHDLTRAPQTRGTQSSPLWQIIKARHPDQRIARVLTLANDTQRKPWRQLHWHVLHRVNSDISTLIQQGRFKFFNKQPLTTHFVQGLIQKLVTPRRHAQQFHLNAWVMPLQLGLDKMGLPQSEWTLASRYCY